MPIAEVVKLLLRKQKRAVNFFSALFLHHKTREQTATEKIIAKFQQKKHLFHSIISFFVSAD